MYDFRWVKKYGGIVRFYHLLGRERILVADPEALKYVMVTNEGNYERLLGNSRQVSEHTTYLKNMIKIKLFSNLIMSTPLPP